LDSTSCDTCWQEGAGSPTTNFEQADLVTTRPIEKGVEVSFVGAAGDLLVAGQIRDPLVHRAPDHPEFPVPLTLAAHAEFARLVDHRLHAD